MTLKYGRRAPKNAPALLLAHFLTSAVPSHPTSQDNLAALRDWQMLGNDAAGDCVAVTWANFRRLVTSVLGAKEVYPTQDQVWQVYRTQNPDFDPNGSADDNGPGSDADQGMDIQTLLEYLVKTGGPDGVKALGFAKVDYTNSAEVDAALSIFGGTWTGMNVQADQQDQFSEGQDWDWVKGSPVEGGHSVLSGGYDPARKKFVTWAQETAYTDAFETKGVEEQWVVIWPEHLGTKEFQEGIDLAAFAAAYKALTGRDFPVVVPTPTPVPIDADGTLWAATKHWTTLPHVGANATAAHAVKTWANAKNLS